MGETIVSGPRSMLAGMARQQSCRPQLVREVKEFARVKLAQTQNVSAGTLNPHLPKRTIAAAKMLEWLEGPDEDDLA